MASSPSIPGKITANVPSLRRKIPSSLRSLPTMLDRYRDIAERLARAEGLTDDDARALAAEGKAVVWIDGGLHATEVLGAQQLIELVYQMVSGTDPETVRFLDDIILLAVHCNPDSTTSSAVKRANSQNGRRPVWIAANRKSPNTSSVAS